jgi:hypothetical protein
MRQTVCEAVIGSPCQGEKRKSSARLIAVTMAATLTNKFHTAKTASWRALLTACLWLTLGGHVCRADRLQLGSSNAQFLVYEDTNNDGIFDAGDTLATTAPIGDTCFIVLQLSVGEGEQVASSSVGVEVKETDPIHNGQAYFTAPIDLTTGNWTSSTDGGNTWATGSVPHGAVAAQQTLYQGWIPWNTTNWVSNAGVTFGHNGNHVISVCSVDGNTSQTE